MVSQHFLVLNMTSVIFIFIRVIYALIQWYCETLPTLPVQETQNNSPYSRTSSKLITHQQLVSFSHQIIGNNIEQNSIKSKSLTLSFLYSTRWLCPHYSYYVLLSDHAGSPSLRYCCKHSEYKKMMTSIVSILPSN